MEGKGFEALEAMLSVTISVADIVFLPKVVDGKNVGDHPHFVIAEDGGTLYMFCGQSCQATMVNLAEYRGYDYGSMPWIGMGEQNQLSKITYVDCNVEFDTNATKLLGMIKKGEAQYAGKLTKDEFDQVRAGAIASGRISELLIEMMIHPDADQEEDS